MDNLDKIKEIIRTIIEQGYTLEKKEVFKDRILDISKPGRLETKMEIQNYHDNL